MTFTVEHFLPSPFQLLGLLALLLVTLMMPVVATAAGVAFLDEVILTRSIVGAAIVLVALTLIDGRVLRVFARSHRGEGD